MLRSLFNELLGSRATGKRTTRAAVRDGFRVLNVGGGSKSFALPGHYSGWEHVLLDIEPGKGVDLVHDARDLAALPAASFDAVYCSHNLEHYHVHEVPRVLGGFSHVLKPAGFVEIRVPDLAAVLRSMHERGLDIEDTLYASPAGPVSVRDVLYGLGSAIAMGKLSYAHKTGFTERSLRAALRESGFRQVLPLIPIGGYEVRLAAFRSAELPPHAAMLPVDHSSTLRARDAKGGR